jgi:hypothetical protein
MKPLMLRPLSPRWLDVVLLLGFIALILALSGCTVTGLTGERPLTTREQVYQAGGVLLGITQELEFAIRNKTVQGETAEKLVKASEVAFAVYRKASTYAIAGNEQAASTARLELLRLIDSLRRDLTAALVKP